MTRIGRLPEEQAGERGGAAFVYFLPHLGDDFLKIGFSRDPLQRMRQFHRRYFDFFDLERVAFIETDRVAEARAIELELKRRFHEHRSPAPLDVRLDVGGETEWFRGIDAHIGAILDEYETLHYRVHRQGEVWLRQRVREHATRLFDWSSLQFQALQTGSLSLVDAQAVAEGLRDELDALDRFGISIEETTPAEVALWYRANRR